MKAFDEDYDTPIIPGNKVLSSVVETLQWMQPEQHFVSAQSVHILYIVVVRKSFQPELKRYIMQKKKGINFELLTNPVEILEDDENGNVKGMKCIPHGTWRA